MQIVSYNVNGLRAVLKKGFLDWLRTVSPEVLCLQEIKATEADIDVAALEALGYRCHWFSAQKKGYSGVATFIKGRACEAFSGTGHAQSDTEGRVLRTDIGDLTIVNAYFPSGTTGSVRQDYKYQWLEEFYGWLTALSGYRKNILVCGDFNIAHTEADIHNPKGNAKNSGFLLPERAWMDQLLKAGFVDVFRHLHPDVKNSYTWWSQRFPHLRAENKGWRIDYICASAPLRDRLRSAEHLSEVAFSDHCPVLVGLHLDAL